MTQHSKSTWHRVSTKGKGKQDLLVTKMTTKGKGQHIFEEVPAVSCISLSPEDPAVSCMSLSLEAVSVSGISLSPEDPAGLCLLLSSLSPEDPACLCLLPEYTADICTSSSCCVGSSLILTTVASADDVKLQTIELEQGKINTSSSLADLSGMDGTRGAHQVDDIDAVHQTWCHEADDKTDPDEAHQPDPVQQICHGRK